MQWCVNMFWKLCCFQKPVSGAALSTLHPPELSQPGQLCPGLRVKDAASGLARFCIAADELSQHPGNEHPGNCGAETLSGQKKKN